MTAHAKLAEKLQAHPALAERMLALIDIVEAEPGHLDRASEAEDAVIEQVREMGKELLTDWGACDCSPPYRVNMRLSPIK